MTVSLTQAQSDLPALIDRLAQDKEIVITRDGEAVAKLIGPPLSASTPRKPGWAKGMIEHISDDFGAPLGDFKEYAT